MDSLLTKQYRLVYEDILFLFDTIRIYSRLPGRKSVHGFVDALNVLLQSDTEHSADNVKLKLSDNQSLFGIVWALVYGILFDFIIEEVSQFPFWTVKVLISLDQPNNLSNLNKSTASFPINTNGIIKDWFCRLHDIIFGQESSSSYSSMLQGAIPYVAYTVGSRSAQLSPLLYTFFEDLLPLLPRASSLTSSSTSMTPSPNKVSPPSPAIVDEDVIATSHNAPDMPNTTLATQAASDETASMDVPSLDKTPSVRTGSSLPALTESVDMHESRLPNHTRASSTKTTRISEAKATRDGLLPFHGGGHASEGRRRSSTSEKVSRRVHQEVKADGRGRSHTTDKADAVCNAAQGWGSSQSSSGVRRHSTRSTKAGVIKCNADESRPTSEEHAPVDGSHQPGFSRHVLGYLRRVGTALLLQPALSVALKVVLSPDLWGRNWVSGVLNIVSKEGVTGLYRGFRTTMLLALIPSSWVLLSAAMEPLLYEAIAHDSNKKEAPAPAHPIGSQSLLLSALYWSRRQLSRWTSCGRSFSSCCRVLAVHNLLGVLQILPGFLSFCLCKLAFLMLFGPSRKRLAQYKTRKKMLKSAWSNGLKNTKNNKNGKKRS